MLCIIATTLIATFRMPDALTQAHFTGRSTVTVEFGVDLPIEIERLPWLVGAIDGSDIEVSKDDCSFVFTITHPWIRDEMLRVLWQDPDSGQLTYMVNDMFYLLPEYQAVVWARAVVPSRSERSPRWGYCISLQRGWPVWV
ncbi:hypothetical protein AU476_19330 [Cupriavidus sp. UYMSc13B]|nr:hypothetical protein AU476_19330 [Cupriavidus sp. UYMSc13B]